jgi:polar amino acid transport system permease protein
MTRLVALAIYGALAAVAAVLAIEVVTGLTVTDLAEYGPALARGLALTVAITLTTYFAGSVLALPLAVAEVSSRPALARLARVYCQAFRYTPLLAQLYLVYFGSGEIAPWLERAGLWWLFREPLPCVLLVFTLNTAAYQAHVIAGAVANLPKGQYEAAAALGLPRRAMLRRVLLPQAMITAIRPLGNEFTKMMKASSLASVVTILDLLGATRLVYGETFNFTFYLVAAAVYIALVEASRRIIERLAARFERGINRETAAPSPA